MNDELVDNNILMHIDGDVDTFYANNVLFIEP